MTPTPPRRFAAQSGGAAGRPRPGWQGVFRGSGVLAAMFFQLSPGTKVSFPRTKKSRRGRRSHERQDLFRCSLPVPPVLRTRIQVSGPPQANLWATAPDSVPRSFPWRFLPSRKAFLASHDYYWLRMDGFLRRVARAFMPSDRRGETMECRIEDKLYDNGVEVCEPRRCFRCDNGQWVEVFLDLAYAGP